MPKLGTYGSVRGALSNGCLYRDCGLLSNETHLARRRSWSLGRPRSGGGNQPGDTLCFVIGVGKDTVLPSLRTVRAVLPHTALQSVVSSSGLARSVGCCHGEQSQVCEVNIWPSSAIVMTEPHSGPLFLLAQDRT